jgi:hypothetical protein
MLSRRTLLAGTPALAAAVPVVGPGDDAELLAAFADWLVAEREYRTIPGDGMTPQNEERISELLAELDDAAWTVAELPAHTPEGVRAKAYILREGLELNFQCTELANQETPDDALLLSLATDLLGPWPKMRPTGRR